MLCSHHPYCCRLSNISSGPIKLFLWESSVDFIHVLITSHWQWSGHLHQTVFFNHSMPPWVISTAAYENELTLAMALVAGELPSRACMLWGFCSKHQASQLKALVMPCLAMPSFVLGRGVAVLTLVRWSCHQPLQPYHMNTGSYLSCSASDPISC